MIVICEECNFIYEIAGIVDEVFNICLTGRSVLNK